ncbi:hypothetical protein HU200_016489 [Digitaria exilis]|uniref:Uncharacterized protein n=1 Tax=Digitaria exilis TaxID=1010633 RepID=A0A835KHC4_9POAL|nr:hypothetical protein HU200_016489 [Digitaria exilis]
MVPFTLTKTHWKAWKPEFLPQASPLASRRSPSPTEVSEGETSLQARRRLNTDSYTASPAFTVAMDNTTLNRFVDESRTSPTVNICGPHSCLRRTLGPTHLADVAIISCTHVSAASWCSSISALHCTAPRGRRWARAAILWAPPKRTSFLVGERRRVHVAASRRRRRRRTSKAILCSRRHDPPLHLVIVMASSSSVLSASSLQLVLSRPRVPRPKDDRPIHSMVVVGRRRDDDHGGAAVVVVREFHEGRDRAAVERLEGACEVGPSGGKLCLFTDLLGDPLCRVRHSPPYLMLVAETAASEVVRRGARLRQDGVMRPRKPLLQGRLPPRPPPSPHLTGGEASAAASCRAWRSGSSYPAPSTPTWQPTSATPRPSASSPTAAATPNFAPLSVLVHPVFRHDLSPSSRRRVTIVNLPPRDAELLYRARFASGGGVEFFPSDIDAVLNNPLSLGTFLAVPSSFVSAAGGELELDIEAFMASPPESWAVASVWNSKDAFCLEVRGAPKLLRAAAARATRLADAALSPWRVLRVPSIPDLFEPFGMHFVYGLAGDGDDAPEMARSLCRHAHNVARRGGARVVVTEVAAGDPLRAGVPHWPRLGAEDLWCIKRLADGYGDGELGDWSKAPPGNSIFVDPREF